MSDRRAIAGRTLLLLVLATAVTDAAQEGNKKAAAPPSVSQLEAAVKRTPGDPDAHIALGLAYWGRNEYPRALQQFRRAVEVGPRSAEAHNWLGVALSEKSDLPGAVAEFRKAVELDPRYGRAYTNLGSALATSGDYAEAVAVFQKALTLEPNAWGPTSIWAWRCGGRATWKPRCHTCGARSRATRRTPCFATSSARRCARTATSRAPSPRSKRRSSSIPRSARRTTPSATALRQQSASARRGLPQASGARRCDEPRGGSLPARARCRRARRARSRARRARGGGAPGREPRRRAARARLRARPAGRLRAGAHAPRARGRPAAGVSRGPLQPGRRALVQRKPRQVRRRAAARASSWIPPPATPMRSSEWRSARRAISRGPARACSARSRSLPPTAAVYVDLGITYLRAGELDKALGQLEAGLNLPAPSVPAPDWKLRDRRRCAPLSPASPPRAEAHNVLGLLLGRQGASGGEVAAAFREAIRLRPDFAEAHNNLGLVLVQSGDDAGGIAAFREAVRLDTGLRGRARESRRGARLRPTPRRPSGSSRRPSRWRRPP